jgi:hypothetical protein
MTQVLSDESAAFYPEELSLPGPGSRRTIIAAMLTDILRSHWSRPRILCTVSSAIIVNFGLPQNAV